MKKMQSILLAFALLVGTLSFAANLPETIKEDPTSEQLSKLLKNPGFILTEDASAMVTFLLNDDSEIVVLSVETENVIVESFLKHRLNYNKLGITLEKGKRYILPVLVKATE